MTSFTADDIKRELRDLQDMVQSRADDLNYSSSLDVCLIQGLVSKVSQLATLLTTDATDLFKLVKALGMPDTVKSQLKEAIEIKLAGTSQSIVTSAKPQYLEDINNYFTEAEWGLLENSTCSYQSKVQIVVDRLVSLQLVSLHEQTVKFAVALLLAVHFGQNWPSYQSVYTMVGDFKKCFGASVKNGFCKLVRYPVQPSMLARDMYDKAYPNPDQPPVCKDIERLKMIATLHIPLRSTSALLRTSSSSQPSQPSQPLHPSPQSSPTAGGFFGGVGANQTPEALQMMARMCWPHMFPVNQMTQHPWFNYGGLPTMASTPQAPSQPDQGSASASKPLAIQYSPPKRVASTAITLSENADARLQLRTTDLKDEANEVVEETPTAKTSAEYEDNAFQALLANSQKKNKGKKSAAKSNAKVMKRPAAASSSSEKPAKQVKIAEYAVGDADLTTMSEHSFTSKRYHAAKLQAMRAGSDDYDAKLKARVAYKAAKALWCRSNTDKRLHVAM